MRTSRTASALSAILALASVTAAVEPPAPLPHHAETRRARGPVAFSIDRPLTPGVALTIQVPIDGQIRTIGLAPYTVRSAKYRVLEQRADGKLHDIAPSAPTTVRGNIEGAPGSVVAGGIMPEGLHAAVIMPDGSHWTIQPDPQEGKPTRHIIYTDGDFMIADAACGTKPLVPGRPAMPAAPAGSPGRGVTWSVAELGIDADYEFYFDYSGSDDALARTENRINLLVNIINLQYEREADLTHVISALVIRSSEPDPYTSTDAETLLDEFTVEWREVLVDLDRDLAILLTGKDLDLYAGIATTIGSVCDDTASYCLAQANLSPFDRVITSLCAHELGHLWGACHCLDIIGVPPNPSAPCRSTMNAVVNSYNQFSSWVSGCSGLTAPQAFAAYIATLSCLDTTSGQLPPNDECAFAVALPSSHNTDDYFPIYTNGATTSASPPCGGDMTSDLWYSFTMPGPGTIIVDTCGSLLDTTLAIYSGTCGALTELACNDDCCGTSSFVSASGLSSGQTVLIRVGGKLGGTGEGRLTIQTFLYRPANDRCCAADVVPHNVTESFSTATATTDGPNEATDCTFGSYSQVGSDVWFRYTATCTAPARVRLCGSAFNTKVAVYSGSCGSLGTVLACNDDSCGDDAQVTFAATINAEYLIRVGGFNGATGAGSINVRLAADWDANGDVNSNDISAYLTAWLDSVNNATLDADFNNDNEVNSNDISDFNSAWNASVGC